MWPPGGLRRAGIASYGYGGTVSHAIIEQYQRDPYHIANVNDVKDNGPQILLLSAPQEKRLALQAETQEQCMRRCCQGRLKYDFSAIANTLANRRSHHDYRVAFVVDDHMTAMENLEAFSKGTLNEGVTQSRVLSSGCGADTTWVFSGHGAQWPEMGHELINDSVFMEVVSPLEPIIVAEMEFSAIEALRSGDFSSSDESQVLTYVMQIGLSAVLQSKGVHPQAIIGHSIGEIAASVVAGCLTAAEGALLVCRRSILY